MSYTIAELRAVSDDELIRAHDSITQGVTWGTNDYSMELARRAQERDSTKIKDYTKQVTVLTWVIAIATLVNVILAGVLVFKT